MNLKIKAFKFKKPINLYCFTDLHLGHKDHDYIKFKKAITELKKDKDGYCFFNGDNLEFTPGGYHGASSEQLKTNTNQINEFYELVKSLGNKVLFFRSGNHEARAADLCDVDIYNTLGKVLKIPELHRGMEEVHIYINGKPLRLVSSHGEGGSSKRSLQNMQLTFPGADVYFTGHTHEMIVNSGNMHIRTNTGEMLFKKQLEIVGGSYLGWADYARNKNMRPTETGCYVLRFAEDGVKIKGELI